MATHLDVIGFEDRAITYPVVGKSVEAIKRSMAERTIVPTGDCFTTLHHCYSFPSVRGLLLLYQIVVIKPEWNRKGAGKEVEKEWDRYMTAATDHENRHVKIYSTAYRRLKELGQAERAADIVALGQKYNERYDSETDHGRLEGARIGSTVEPTDFSELVNQFVKEIERAT